MKKEKTGTIEITITLPDTLVREAESKGLLTPEALEALLRAEIKRQRVNRLFEAADRAASIGLPPMTEDEVDEEIQAVRHKKRTSHASGS